MRKLFDGPVRTRVFWTTVFATAVTFAAFFGFDLSAYETTFLLILDLLIAVGALSGTTGTQEIPDGVEKGW